MNVFKKTQLFSYRKNNNKVNNYKIIDKEVTDKEYQ